MLFQPIKLEIFCILTIIKEYQIVIKERVKSIIKKIFYDFVFVRIKTPCCVQYI